MEQDEWDYEDECQALERKFQKAIGIVVIIFLVIVCILHFNP